MTSFTFSRFVYFDTNIISHFAKHRERWSSLFEFLEGNDLTLGISGAQIVELSDATGLHEDITALFLSIPSGILKTWDTILDEEVKSYPNERKKSLLLSPLNAIGSDANAIKNLSELLFSQKLIEARRNQLKQAQLMHARHAQLKENFPPSKIGKYTRYQADEFTWRMVVQWLASTHFNFLAGAQEDIGNFHSEIFLSVRIFAYVIFYKYYLGQRNPKRLSDFGDLAHLAYIPYCELVVMERDLCNVLNQIKRNHNILRSTMVHDIDFLEYWH